MDRNEEASAESICGSTRAPSSRSAGALDWALQWALQDAWTAFWGAQHASRLLWPLTQQARHAGGARLSNKPASIATITAPRMEPFYARGDLIALHCEKMELPQLSGAACFGAPQPEIKSVKVAAQRLFRRQLRAAQITCTGLSNE